MNKIVISLILSGCLFASCTEHEKGITGTWYGLQYGAPMTVEINDSTITVKSEASSNSSFSSPYKLEMTGKNTFNIDMCAAGMSGLGIGEINGDDLKIGVVFGRGGQAERPASLEEVQKNMASVSLNVSRNKGAVLSVLDEQVDAPESARLAFERNLRLGHGINLNNVVDGNSHEGNPADQPFTEFDAKRIADAGFKSVRLATCWVKHALPEAPYTIDPAFFEKVDGIVNLCLKHDLAVSIDVHYYPYINMSEPDPVLDFEQNIERLAAFWEQIAEHYKNMPNDLVYFDLLNEPAPSLIPDRYNKMIANLIGIVRKTNPERTIIIGTPSLGQHWTIGELRFPENEWNLIVQAHYYLPHTFSHQGLSYAPGAEQKGVKWMGTDKEKAPILQDFDYLARWSQAQCRPVNIGEFGVNEVADVDSRARYLGFIRQMVDSHNMSFHLWGYREVFNIMDPATGTWETKALEALNY